MGEQLPLRPEDLAGPPLEGQAFIRSLREEKANRYPEPPPLYRALYDGTLDKEALKLWVKDLYQYWDHTMHYSTGAIYIKTNDPVVRPNILRKVVDIEGEEIVNDLIGSTTPAYEELWLRLGEGLGIPREETISWKPFTRTHFAMTTLCLYSRWWEWSWLDGVASIYAADLHGEECLGQAYQALKKSYGLPEESLEFFPAYLEDLPTHIPWEEQALAYWCCTKERQLTAARAFRERLDIENQLLVAVEKTVTTGNMQLQVP